MESEIIELEFENCVESLYLPGERPRPNYVCDLPDTKIPNIEKNWPFSSQVLELAIDNLIRAGIANGMRMLIRPRLATGVLQRGNDRKNILYLTQEEASTRILNEELLNAEGEEYVPSRAFG